MKRTVIIIAILLIASSAYASGGRPKRPDNISIFGSDDRQHGHNKVVTVDPDRPVHPVPEPSVIILLGAGLVGLAGYARRQK